MPFLTHNRMICIHVLSCISLRTLCWVYLKLFSTFLRFYNSFFLTSRTMPFMVTYRARISIFSLNWLYIDRQFPHKVRGKKYICFKDRIVRNPRKLERTFLGGANKMILRDKKIKNLPICLTIFRKTMKVFNFCWLSQINSLPNKTK